MVVAGVRPIGHYVQGDARVSSGSSEHLATAAADVPLVRNQPGDRPRKDKTRQQQQQPTQPPPPATSTPGPGGSGSTGAILTQTRQGKMICEDVNFGRFIGTASEPCPRGNGRVHKCSKCGGRHSYMECPQISYRTGPPSTKRKGGSGKKEEGK